MLYVDAVTTKYCKILEAVKRGIHYYICFWGKKYLKNKRGVQPLPGLGALPAEAGDRVEEEAEGAGERQPPGSQAPEELGSLVRVTVQTVTQPLTHVPAPSNQSVQPSSGDSLLRWWWVVLL